MSVKVTMDRTKAVLASIKTLSANRVLVGIPSTTAEREPDPDDPQPLTNAEVGYIMEFGAPEANIPARPHLIPAVQEVSPDVAKRYEAGTRAVLDGKVQSIDNIHDQVGLMASSAVKRKITEGPFTPLADATIDQRRRRGRTGTKPLIDTGQYRNAQTYVIRPKG